MGYLSSRFSRAIRFNNINGQPLPVDDFIRVVFAGFVVGMNIIGLVSVSVGQTKHVAELNGGIFAHVA